MKKIYSIVLVLVLLTSVVNAQTTYTWNVVGNGSWATSTNWTPTRTVLAANDVMVINNGGSKTISDIPNQTIGKLQVSGSTTVILRPETTGNRTLTVSTVAADAISVASGSTLTIAGRDAAPDRTLTLTMSNTAGVTASIDGTIGVALDAAQSGANGTFTKGAAATINMNSGSTYIHGRDAGTIPTATWAATSTCTITGLTSNFPGGTGQSFGNLTFNSNLTANVSLNAVTTCVNLTISNGAANVLRVSNSATDRILTVTGDFSQTSGGFALVSNDGDATMNVSGSFFVSGGTFDFNDDNGTGIATLNVAGNFSHTAGTLTRSDISGSGAAGINFNGSSPQIFTSGGTVGTGVNFTVNNGATLNMAAAGTIVSGNSFILSNGGTLGIKSTAGIVTAPTASGNIQTTTRTFNTGANYNYIGSGGQVTGNALPSTVSSFEIDNSAGLSLSQAVAINGDLTMTNGIITATAGQLTVNASGTTSGASDNSYVHGPVTKIGNSNFIFPIGKSPAGYHPVELSNISASETFTAEYIRSSASALGSANSPLTHVSNCEYWDVDRAGSATANVSLYWSASSGCNAFPYVTNLSSLRVAHHNGATWDDNGNISTSGGTGSGSVTSATVSTFSPFTLGAVNFNPLPVKYSNIRAYEKMNGIQIDWISYSELNVDRYVIERSSNGSGFSAIGEVMALNTSNQTPYAFFDANPLPGISYYRLRNLDMDGKSGYSNVVRVDLRKDNKDITLYPNPVRSGGYISYGSANIAKGNYSARIFNAAGQQMFIQKFSHNGGAINQTIQLPASVRSGYYTLQLENEGTKLAAKTFMVQ